MDLNSALTAFLSGLFASIGTYLVLRANRPIVTAQADSTTADTEDKRATTRGRDVESIIGLYERRDLDREKRLAGLEVKLELKDAEQEKKDAEQAALVSDLRGQIASLLKFGVDQAAADQGRTTLIEEMRAESVQHFGKIDQLEDLVLALKEEIIALREQLKGLGHAPGQEATEKAAEVKAAESK